MYEVSGWTYYTQEDQELGVELQLEGVGPTFEKTFELGDNALRR